MGSQTRMAEELNSKYMISLDVAWDRVYLIETARIGDDIEDALYYLLKGNESAAFALDQLRQQHAKLGQTIETLAQLDWIRRDPNGIVNVP